MARMGSRSRFYHSLFLEHLGQRRQMIFVTGARQVGKTTVCKSIGDNYLDWDNDNHRDLIIAGPEAVAQNLDLNTISSTPGVIVFDELHKYTRWRQFIKGFFDTYNERCKILVTGSSRLDTYRRGGDSLMGRYFSYRMHPFSVAEILSQQLPTDVLRTPGAILADDWQALWQYGGYPEPYLSRNVRFSRRWQNLRHTQLLREDIRDLTRVQDLDRLSTLGKILAGRSGTQIIYSRLARDLRVAENTVRNWINVLCSLHYGFLLRPWYRNINKSLRKEPKWYLRDWSGIEDTGSRCETLLACHLLKAVEGWTDLGLGHFDLFYIRDKQKREVDFLVTRDDKPWFLVEAKYNDTHLSPNLAYFQQQLACDHAFQVNLAGDYVERDCFEFNQPIIVPGKTLLSQLL